MSDYRFKILDEYLKLRPRRRPLSIIFPVYSKHILGIKYALRKTKNILLKDIAREKSKQYLKHSVYMHSSPLRRRLNEDDKRLEEGKIKNLNLAIKELEGLVIRPNEIFSIWEIIGKPTIKKGYKPGMLISNGKISEGEGGGLCQLANLLHFIFLHTELQIIERYHHSLDVFPDSGRKVPFASGATIMYNFLDLQVKNNTKKTFQLRFEITQTQLKCWLLSDSISSIKFHILGKNEIFIRKDNNFYRYNEIWRESFLKGNKIGEEKLYYNIAPVMYDYNGEFIDYK